MASTTNQSMKNKWPWTRWKLKPTSSAGTEEEAIWEVADTPRKKLHNLIVALNDSCAWIAVLLPYVFYFLGIMIATGILSHGLWHIRDVAIAGQEINEGQNNVWEAFSSLIFVLSIIVETIVCGIVLYQYLVVYPERLNQFDTYLAEQFTFLDGKMAKKFAQRTLRRYFVYAQMHFVHHLEGFDFADIAERG